MDSVVIKSSEAPQEDPAHVDKMLALVDSAEAVTKDEPEIVAEVKEDRPQWLPEKFKSAEDMAKAYAELESKLGTKPAAEPAKAEEAEQQTAEEVLESKGLKFEDFSAEFEQSGELSEASYEKLAKSGIPREIVDQYIAGSKALSQKYEESIKSDIGGAENFNTMSQWAQANVSKEELAAYNKAVSSGDVGQARLAVMGLYSRYQAAGHGSEPKLIHGAGAASTSNSYASFAEMQEDMKNPKYKNDPAFRKMVASKLEKSSIF